MAYNTPETVADYLARFQMEITHRGKGTFTPDHVKYSLTIASGGKDFFTTFESNPHVHGEPTITQVFGALASDAMVVRDYGMDEFVDEFCDGMKPSAAIRAYNSCKETYDWMRDGLYLSNGDIASLSEVISENEEEIGALVENMEFSGSLPGDEKDEDGYSLTGEAKDATASRNGLSRNQMGIEEKAAECMEAATVLANDNAL